MKVVIAPDSFKDSLSALKVAQAIAQGWQAVFPHAETICAPWQMAVKEPLKQF